MQYSLIAPNIEGIEAIDQVLINRGFAQQDIRHYLRTNDADILDVNLIDNIKEGVEILIKHIYNNDYMYVQVDSDCDGYTSAAAFINYLNMIFPNYAQNRIRYCLHEDKSHGIMMDAIPPNTKIVVVPDASSNEYDYHKQLHDEDIDVLIIDHHHADKVSEYACVINNQLCDYPTKSLSGVGMVYKFCSLIDQLLGKKYADDILDLVALGLIADMVDIRDFETRHLITRGLDNLRNPFVRGMSQKQEFSISKAGGLNPHSVAFYIAPLVNAIARSGTYAEKNRLFESMLDFKAYKQIPSTKRGCKGQYETIVEQALRNCTNAKNRQTKEEEKGILLINSLIEEHNLLDNKILLIKLPEYASIDRNIAGLVANKIASKYQRPTLILSQVIKDGVICWEGSGRGYEKSRLTDFRKFLIDSQYFYLAEGHSNAFGAGITEDNIKNFITYANEILKDYDFTPSYKVDYIFNGDKVDSEIILSIANWRHLWGQNISEPLICIENLKVTKENIELMAKNTLKITLPKSNVSIIKFAATDEEYEALLSESGYKLVNLVGYCARNDWNDTAQIKLVDYEIIGGVSYYF